MSATAPTLPTAHRLPGPPPRRGLQVLVAVLALHAAALWVAERALVASPRVAPRPPVAVRLLAMPLPATAPRPLPQAAAAHPAPPRPAPPPRVAPTPPVHPMAPRPPTPPRVAPTPVAPPAPTAPAPAAAPATAPSAAPPVAQTQPAAAPAPVAAPAPPTPPGFGAAYLHNPKPVYPPGAQRLGEEGTVRLRVRVSASGGVDAVSVSESCGYPRLDQAALDAVRGWTFVPATSGGHPVAGTVIVPVHFSLGD